MVQIIAVRGDILLCNRENSRQLACDTCHNVHQVIADFKSKNADANVYWHDMTMAAYQRLYEDFTSVIKVFANGADPVA